MNRAAVALALCSALLFGASTPAAKLLLGGIDPWMMAALLYLGAGFGAGLGLGAAFGLGALQRLRGVRRMRAEASLRRADLPWLAAVIGFGGGLGPLLLMLGLARSDAASASLLLNGEGVATMAIAWLLFREAVDRRLLLGAFAILSGGALLAWPAAGMRLDAGAPLIAGACLCWGIDNNLTQKLSMQDPVQIAALKGLGAGLVNLLLALSRGAALPRLNLTLEAASVGFLGYGVSLVLFVLALRHLGTARTGAYFATGPFVGAILAIPMLGAPPNPALLAAGALMALGVWLHLAERHAHAHSHEALAHAHRHRHDAHHRHGHGPGIAPGEPHSHWHRHAPMRHTHPHTPDPHHRHSHGSHA